MQELRTADFESCRLRSLLQLFALMFDHTHQSQKPKTEQEQQANKQKQKTNPQAHNFFLC